MTVVERVFAAGALAMGLFAVVRNRVFAGSSVRAARGAYGRPMREGSREYRFTWLFTRTMAIVVGAALAVTGALGVLGIDWRDLYR